MSLKWKRIAVGGYEADGYQGLRYKIHTPDWATDSWWLTVYGPLGGCHCRAQSVPLVEAVDAAEDHDRQVREKSAQLQRQGSR